MTEEKQNRTPDHSAASDAQAAGSSGTAAGHRTGVLGSLWFVAKAIEIRLRFVAVLVGIGLVIGYWDTIRNYWDKWTRPAAGSGVALSADSEFYCPMHPSVVRDKPDAGGAVPKCPICGMPLSKRKKGETAALPEGVVSRVQLSPYRVQLAGIRTAELELQPLTVDLRAVGYVAIDERKLSRIVVRAEGYIEKLFVNESFAEVAPNEPLAEVYSPELYSAAQELLIAKSGGGVRELADIAYEKLRLLGVADQEIEHIVKSGKAVPRLLIRSPHGGHVFEKRVVEGDQVTAGQTLFEVADLATVWVEAEVYEKDAALLRRGQAVEASVEAFPGRVFTGTLSLVHPHVETATRTLRVRFELENPGHVLRPGMFATVKLSTPVQDLEPFHSQLMAQHSTNASPLTDAELIAQQKNCPVTGAKLGSMGAPIRAAAGGQTVFLCCAGCESKLAAEPDHYLARLIRVREDAVLAVPELAVIDTGSQKVVYVEREPGLFEGVAVTLGPLSNGFYAVADGLLPGDRVAAAGAFLVDAETRLNPTASAAYFGASGGPSSGGSSASPSHSSHAAGEPLASASGPDAKALANIAKLPEADRALATQQRLCPVTNMPLGSMGMPVKVTSGSDAAFLCCEGCRGKATADPAGIAKRVRELKAAGSVGTSGGRP